MQTSSGSSITTVHLHFDSSFQEEEATGHEDVRTADL
jgi:hypothetical protein